MEFHNIEPVYDNESRILILGSFPSVKSRQAQFFYHHEQNRFWKVLALVFADELPVTIAEKKQFLYKHHIALWDVIASCEIKGSSDSSIRNVKVNDLDKIISYSPIKHIYTNGRLSDTFFHRYFHYDIPCAMLPSTSSANARYRLEDLVACWQVINI